MKLERLNELLKKLVQMEDAEENLEMVPLYEEALELSKEIYGEHNLKTLEIYNNYGGHLRNLGLYEKAEYILRKAVVCAKLCGEKSILIMRQRLLILPIYFE